MRVLVINCGSATLKYKLFEDRNAGLEQLAAAVVETTGGYRAAVGQVLAALPAPADVIAHRVVHGGGRLPDLVGIDGRVLGILREVTPPGAAAQRARARGHRGHPRLGSAADRGAGLGLPRHPPAPRLAVRHP
jgi:acetate kinase